MSDEVLIALNEARNRILEERHDSEAYITEFGPALEAAHKHIARCNDKLRQLDAAIQDRIVPLTPAPEAEPGSGHGEIEDPTAVAIAAYIEAEQGGYPDLTAEQTAAIDSATADYQSTEGSQIVSGEPWESSAGYQHVVDAEPAGGDDVPRDADGREVDLDSGLVCMRDKHPEPDGEGTPVPGGLQLANGTKPDLPDDTLVDILYRGDWGMPRQKVGEVRWSDAAIKFWHLSEPAPLIIADPSSVEELGEQSEPYSAAHEAEEPLTLDQMDEAGITDPDASAMLRMMTARKLEGVE